MSQVALKLTSVSKKYVLRHENPTLAESVFARKTNEEFWALRDINLSIKKGERVGVIGPNGAGKTTLLKIISGITTPTSGVVTAKGRIVSLIELEAGFHPELTGEENIFLNGLLLGMSKEEIKSKLKRIISFTDIGKFIDSPIYTYSQGMKLRLGFSIAIYANPDTLVLDENISIGDQGFRDKSFQKMQDLFVQGKTIIIATHYIDYLKSRCRRVIWLDRGRIKKDGLRQNISRLYKSSYPRIN